MRCLIERVKEAECIIDNLSHSKIGKGLLVYVAFEEKDNNQIIDKALEKIKKLRIFTDNQGKLNLSIDQVEGEVMIISSFSLFADLYTGSRPSFSKSLSFSCAKPLYDYTISKAKDMFKLSSGIFGADMRILSTNDGPVSLILDI